MSINPFGDAAEQLVAHFYAWERRGRGWDVHPYPVELEPPFRRFEHYVRVPVDVDDGRRPSMLLSALTLGLAGRSSRQLEPEGEEEPEPLPAPFVAQPISELHLLLPEGFDSGKGAAEAFLQVARASRQPIGVELIGTGGTVCLQVTCALPHSAAIAHQLSTAAPGAAVLARDGFLAGAWGTLPGVPLIADLGLAEEFMRPLRSGVDVLPGLIAALSAAGEGEVACAQLLLTPARANWSREVMRAVLDPEGDPFFATGPELVAQAKKKLASTLFACRLRLAAKSRMRARSVELVRTVLAAFESLSNPPAGNSLIALAQDGWSLETQEHDLLNRTAHRLGMLLSADELASIIHLPGRETVHTPLERLRQRTKAAPDSTHGHRLILGENAHLGARRAVSLSAEQRSRHVYVIGGSGTGKSTLLLNLIEQDIEAGHGLAVLDPHGDLVEAILGRIPAGRIEDVVLIDPADEEHPIGINVLAAHSQLEQTLLASDLVAAFRRQSTSWGDQMNAVFANAIAAILESSEGGTLAELRRFLVEKEYRAAFLRTVADEEVRYYWEKEFPLLRGNAQAPILTRLDAFLRPRLVRNIVTNRNSLDFRRVMDERKILLVKLAQGAIGEENAYLLGALVLSKLQQLALSRQDVEASARPPFYVYLDEFQHLVTPTTTTLLSGVRKYGIGLTLAHQNLTQLSGELVDSVLANAGTRICFRVGDKDAKTLADGFSFFEARDLQNLDTGQAIARAGRAEADFNLAVLPPRQIDSEATRSRTAEVVAASRRQWTSPAPPAASAPETRVPVFAVVRPQREEEEPPPATPPAPAAPTPRHAQTAPATPGRGGAQHKYLQALIKGLGEERGFKATVEQSVLDGSGSVDVVLERGETKIGFEITVTTPTAHELGNVRKCLEAGLDLVVLVAADQKSVSRLNAGLKTSLSDDESNKVHCLGPEALPALLDQLAADGTTVEQSVAGYTVRVSAGSAGKLRLPAAEKIRDILARSLKRSK